MIHLITSDFYRLCTWLQTRQTTYTALLWKWSFLFCFLGPQPQKPTLKLIFHPNKFSACLHLGHECQSHMKPYAKSCCWIPTCKKIAQIYICWKLAHTKHWIWAQLGSRYCVSCTPLSYRNKMSNYWHWCSSVTLWTCVFCHMYK